MRFRSSLALCLLIMFAPMAHAAQNIFSDLGAGGTYSPYQSGGGRSVSGGKNQAPNSPAYSFVAGSTLPLTQIDLALSYVSGTNGAVVTLWSAVPWSVYVGPGFGAIAPGVQLGSWTMGPVPLASANSGNALTTIAGIQGISLVAGTQYFLQVSAVANDTFLIWNNNTTGSTSTLSQCGGYNSTYTTCTAGIISYANVSDGGFDLLGMVPQVQPQTPITITETGVVTSYTNGSIPRGSPSPVTLGTPFTLTTVLYPSDITPILTIPPSYSGFYKGTVTLLLGGVSYQEPNPGTTVYLAAPMTNGYSGIQIYSGSPGSGVLSTVSSSPLPIPDAFSYQNGTVNFSSNVQGAVSVSNWTSVPILTNATLGGQITTLTVQATRTDTVFAATCLIGTGCNLSPYGESATISFPYSVPLDGSIFSGPAQLNVNISGSQQTVILPSHYGFFFGPVPAGSVGGNINALQLPYPVGLGTLTVAGTPPPPQFLLQPDPGLDSADFVFATIGETHFFEVYGSYANGAGFELNEVAFTLQPAVQPPLQITSSSLPSAVSHTAYSAGLSASGGTNTGYIWSLASGSLPNGFSLSASGVISTTGTPAALAKSYTFSVTVSDSAANSAAPQTLTLVVTSPPLPAVTILDPVPIGDYPGLLNGTTIIPTKTALGAQGAARTVSGIAADGTAQVVFQAPTLAPNDQVTLSLFSDQCFTPTTCSPSTSSDDDGGVFTIGAPVTSASQLGSTETDIADANTVSTFFGYRAPIDFVRLFDNADAGLTGRFVYLQFSYSSGGTTYGTQIVRFAIVRPPVVLIHGTFSDPSVFNTFSPLLPSTVAGNPFFSITTLDYSDNIDPLVSNTLPTYSAATRLINPISRNVAGIAYNSPLLLNDLIKQINIFRAGASPAGIPVAAVRADIVAHSLGGLMARAMQHVGTTFPGTPYYGGNSYGSGYVHKLITLGTPHLGTNLAQRTLDGTNACYRDLGALGGDYNFVSLVINGKSYSGAVADQSGDPTAHSLSSTLQFLNQSLPAILPTAFIAARFNEINNSLEIDLVGATVKAACGSKTVLPDGTIVIGTISPGLVIPGNFLADNYSFDGWANIYNNQPNDVVVPFASAQFGQPIIPNGIFTGLVHGPGSVGVPGLGFAGPDLLDPASAVPNAVLKRLNTNVKDGSYFINIP